jgi:branched-chain amino acid transport system substrate-binding protein
MRRLNGMVAGAIGAIALAVGATVAAAQEPIKIGFGMALSGPLAANGKQALLAMKIWEEETNAKGGLLGRKVKLVFYDDQSSPATVPGIYTKLIDVDKVDLVLGGYATNQVVPALPIVMQKGKMIIGLFAADANHKFKYPKYFSMIPIGQNVSSFTEGFFQVAAKQNPKPKTIAMARADAEFAHNVCGGARENAKKYGFQIVYDKSYPPATQDFAPIVRAVQSTNPDLFMVCSYPLDSVGMVRAVTEVGFKPKMFGGSMVGLQATVFKNQLKGKLNGIVNYETWVPSMKYEGTDAFFKKYQERAKAEGVDPLGYYLGGWGYAYIQVLGQAVRDAKSIKDDDVAAALRKGTFKTVMGDIKFGDKGEWVESGMLAVQYHDITDAANVETWRGMSYQTVLTPEKLKTGNVIYPYEKALK